MPIACSSCLDTFPATRRRSAECIFSSHSSTTCRNMSSSSVLDRLWAAMDRETAVYRVPDYLASQEEAVVSSKGFRFDEETRLVLGTWALNGTSTWRIRWK